jgi:hypothetical protein
MLDANDLAYERLMGGRQDIWIEWIRWGVGDPCLLEQVVVVAAY